MEFEKLSPSSWPSGAKREQKRSAKRGLNCLLLLPHLSQGFLTHSLFSFKRLLLWPHPQGPHHLPCLLVQALPEVQRECDPCQGGGRGGGGGGEEADVEEDRGEGGIEESKP